MEEDIKIEPESKPAAQFIPPILRGLLFRERGHQRSGITKNKSQGTPKAKRKMVRESRRKNRRANQ